MDQSTQYNNGLPNTIYNPPLQQTSYNPPFQQTSYNPPPIPQAQQPVQPSYQQQPQPMHFESTQPRMSAISTTSVNGNDPNGKREQFKYFPPGQRKKPTTPVPGNPQNIAPQTVETKFSA